MSERFSRLFTLAPNQYAEGSPVLLCAGALLKDQVAGQILAQLKFRSLSLLRIKALTVTLCLQDPAGRPIGTPVSYQYLDLLAARNEEFGQKQAIPLSESSTRFFSVTVDEVIFEDNSIYTGSGEVFSPLPDFTPLSDALESPELVKQFTMACGGGNCTYAPKRVRGLLYCTCGYINTAGEDLCPNCHRSFARLSGAMDLDRLTEAMEQRLEEEAEARAKEAAKKQAAMLRARKRAKIAVATAASLAVVGTVAFFLTTKVIIPNSKYQHAVALMEAGEYNDAIAAFEAMDGYKNSTEQISECKYRFAVTLMEAGQYEEAIAAFEAMAGYKNSTEQISECKYRFAVTLMEAKQYYSAHAIFLALGNYRDCVERIAEIEDRIVISATSLAAGSIYTVGLKADGTVVAVGNNSSRCCDVSRWTDIIAVAAGSSHTVGLKADGTVVAVGNNSSGCCDVSRWTDIIAVAAGSAHTVGLKADGTVVSVGNNSQGQCNVSGWTDIIAVAAGNTYTVGLKADGTVVAVGNNSQGQCNVSGWTDIIAVSAGNTHTVGLKADGTVVAVGNNSQGQCNVSGWTDIKISK